VATTQKNSICERAGGVKKKKETQLGRGVERRGTEAEPGGKLFRNRGTKKLKREPEKPQGTSDGGEKKQGKKKGDRIGTTGTSKIIKKVKKKTSLPESVGPQKREGRKKKKRDMSKTRRQKKNRSQPCKRKWDRRETPV